MHKALVDHSPQMVWVFDANNALTYASPAVTAELGWKSETLIGQPATMLVPPSDLDLYTAAANQVRTTGPGGRAEVEMQVLAANGERIYVNGTISNLTTDPTVAGFVVDVRNVNHRRNYEQQLLERALYDDLTGLPSRALCTDRLARALQLSDLDLIINVVVVNIDNFGRVNEELGFAAADELLRNVAARMVAAVPRSVVVGRMHADEFLVTSTSTESNRGELVAAVNRAFTKPFMIDGRSVKLSASMGLVSATRSDATAEDMITKAEAAVHEAKSHGSGQAVTWSQPLDARARHRTQTESELRRAIDGNELLIYFQPIVDMANNTYAGVEALVRWQHPTRGIVPPSEFITIAEETGMIVPIGEWVLENTVFSVAALNREYGGRPLYGVVNLSARQLADPDFTGRVRASLSRSGLNPGLLHFDITEAVIQPGPTVVGLRLDELRMIGTEIAIDDFGTGYSSIAALRRSQASYVKIDRAFVNELGTDGQEVVSGIIGLAHSLGFDTIAEGVETEDQLMALRRLGCRYSQGYLHARPVPFDELWALLLAQQPSAPAPAPLTPPDAATSSESVTRVAQ